jgi:hypothetical protein
VQRFDRDAISGRQIGDAFAHGDDHAGILVPRIAGMFFWDEIIDLTLCKSGAQIDSPRVNNAASRRLDFHLLVAQTARIGVPSHTVLFSLTQTNCLFSLYDSNFSQTVLLIDH